MKAILLTRTGDPSVLDYVDVPTPDVALAVRKITRNGSTRIAETAFPARHDASQECVRRP